jgi:aldehyde dehydrogenase (NAD+)
MSIVKHKDVKVISFTGSSDVGRQINEIGGKMLKRVSCELGGKNAVIVMDDADIDLAVDGCIWGAYGTTGQRCTATSRIILHKKIKSDFMDKFLKRVKELKIGNGLEEATEMGPLVSKAQLETVHSYVEIGKKEGAELILGGQRLTGGIYDKGFFYAPTVFDNVKREMRIAREEIFGPVVSVFTVDSLEEAIETHNDTDYGLSGSIYTGDVNRAFTAMRDLEIGVVYINAPTIGAESHLPFGGFKDTGNGHREGAYTIYEVFTEWKTIFVDFSGSLQRAQIDIDKIKVEG